MDAELIDYGAYVSSSLREGETTLRNVGGRTRVRQQNAEPIYNTYTRWGATGRYGYGYGRARAGYATASVEDLSAEQHERNRIRTEERVAGASSQRDVLQEIAVATGEIKRNMTVKYEAEF